MENFIIFQVSVFVFAVASAFEEAAFTYPFRNLGEEQFPWQKKKQLLNTAHRSGGFGVLLLLSSYGYTNGMEHGWIAGLYSFAGCGFWYWLTFDIVFALKINQKWFYLGSTPVFDKLVGKVLGKNAGQIKALFCVIMLIAINLTYKFFIK